MAKNTPTKDEHERARPATMLLIVCSTVFLCFATPKVLHSCAAERESARAVPSVCRDKALSGCGSTLECDHPQHKMGKVRGTDEIGCGHFTVCACVSSSAPPKP